MIGKKIIHLDSVDSTNNYVANMILNNQIEHGTVIMSDEQTAGKGQRGNLWFSKPGENVSILIENQLISTKIEHSIIGIGLNTNQKEFSDLNATSMFNETLEFNPIHHVLLSLIGEMNQLFVELENENFEKLKSEYLENLWLLNTISSFTDEKGEFMGKIIGVSEIGLLQILNNNQLKEYNLKELKFNARNEF